MKRAIRLEVHDFYISDIDESAKLKLRSTERGWKAHHQASLTVTTTNSTMLVEILTLNSLIEIDSFGMSLISSSYAALSKGAVTVDKLWSGEIHDLPTYVFNALRLRH